MHSTRNIAQRMGRDGPHPRTAIFGWIAFVLVAPSWQLGLPAKPLDENDQGVGESGLRQTHDEAFTSDQSARRSRCSSRPYRGPLAKADLEAIAGEVDAKVGRSRSDRHAGAGRSTDGRAAWIRFEIRGGAAEKAIDEVAPVEAAVVSIAANHRSCASSSSATRRASKKFDEKLKSDFKKAETLSIPITLIILIVAFGALLAAGIPVLLGLSSVFAAIGLPAVSASSCRSPRARRS